MKIPFKSISLLTLLAVTSSAYSYEAIYAIGTDQQQCYAKAMIGFDSVINSRVGVLPEHALDLAIKTNLEVSADGAKEYSEEILKTVLGAYLWESSPHSYAVNVFFDCAAHRSSLNSAHSSMNIFQ